MTQGGRGRGDNKIDARIGNALKNKVSTIVEVIRVVAVPTVQNVSASAAIERVITGTSVQRVIPCAALKRIIAQIPIERVKPIKTFQ
jgi:hypothetical protein